MIMITSLLRAQFNILYYHDHDNVSAKSTIHNPQNTFEENEKREIEDRYEFHAFGLNYQSLEQRKVTS